MTKALITGGAGFIGLHLAEHLLERSWNVDLLDNFSRAVKDEDISRISARSGVHVLSLDLLNPSAVAGLDDDYDYIFHLAAIIGVQHVLERPFAVLRDNTAMMFNILELAARQKQLERLLFTSTSEVYAGTLKYFGMDIPTPEDTPLTLTDLAHPRTSYMLSKIYGEALCRQAPVPTTILRPHNVYGPRMGMSHVVPELLSRAYQACEGEELRVYSPDHTRTFCYVDDAVNIIRCAAQSPACSNQVLNLGTQKPETRIGDLAELVVATVGKTLTLTPMPPTPGSPERRCPDMTRTTELTGFVSQVSLKEGLKRTFAWYRERVFDKGGVCAK